jgi:phosphatidylinositol phospholipase C gamma-1
MFMHSALKVITLLLHFVLVALSEKECELWVRGLRHLVPGTVAASYPLQVERWLRKEFYSMENSREM